MPPNSLACLTNSGLVELWEREPSVRPAGASCEVQATTMHIATTASARVEWLLIGMRSIGGVQYS